MDKLIEIARQTVGQFDLNGFKNSSAGDVAAALRTKDGNIYTGVCIILPCGIGFCAEHSAIADMLKNRETIIDTIVAVNNKGEIIPPCGRCREFMYQVDFKNIDANIVISENDTVKLSKLLPDTWC